MFEKFIFKYVFMGILLGILIFVLFINSLNRLERKLRPTFDALCEVQVKKEVNVCIDKSVTYSHNEKLYEPQDFYNVTFDEFGNVSLIENNSIIINEITNDISSTLDLELGRLEDVRMKFRVLDFFYPEIFDNLGPFYNMRMVRDGYTDISYKSEINEVSGNQTNFKAYVQIVVYVRVISPLYSENITVNRDVMLVDTVISTKNVGLRIN